MKHRVSYLQLWGSALFMQAVVEGFFGVEPMPPNSVRVKPKILPSLKAKLKDLKVFNSIIDISYIKAAVVEFISTCVGVLTFIPGGIGVSEFSTVLLLQKMGFDLTLATTAGILIRFPMLLVLVLGFLEIIYIFFWSKKTRMDPN